MGTITAELFEQVTPNTVRNFIGLARGTRPWLDPKSKMLVLRPLYDNITFHRVIPDFMIQTGDPTGTGAHNCGFTLNDEIVPTLKFDRPGQVVDGQNVVPKITHVIRDGNDKPRFPVKLIHVNIVRIVPAVEQQTPSVTGPGFFVNPSGDILTSYQIVQSCTEIRLPDGSKLSLAVFDRQNDLALLHSGKPTDSVATFGEANGAPAGEPLAVGGKVMIKAAIAEGFLDANHVSYSKSEQPPNSEAAGKYTVQVQCWK
jgi:cyclophilin family peptidyl-prolyl cis-trans isomerase